MVDQGWKEISLWVFERQLGPNKVEHLGYGREGLVWTVGELTRQQEGLLEEYQLYPSENLKKVIDQLGGKIVDAQLELAHTKSLLAATAAATGGDCSSICYGATADAFPLSGSQGQGVGAIADATLSSSCGFSGDTYAYAYARATLNGTTTTITQEDPHTGTSAHSHAVATVNGASNCSSTANSYAQSTALGISYTTSQSNSSCPLPAPTISGSATASISGTSCQTLTWSATPNGGVSPFSYAWAIDGTAAGTSASTSVSKTYCGNNTAHSQTVNVALTLTDSTSQTASSSFTTNISYTAGGPAVTIGGLSSVTDTRCRALTWTSSVSGGIAPYTYAWTVNGASAGNGTSASVTFCPTVVETVSVALTVTDSARASGSATFSTFIDLETSGGTGTGPAPGGGGGGGGGGGLGSGTALNSTTANPGLGSVCGPTPCPRLPVL